MIPEDLEIDEGTEKGLSRGGSRGHWGIIEKSDRGRFERRDGRIRALYGHSIPVKMGFEEGREVGILYHGMTRKAALRTLREGLKSMRSWAHLSPTIEIARR